MKNNEKDIKKLEELKDFDSSFGVEKIIGIDEVGRGPLAGPVVVCGVIMKEDSNIVGVKDSKKISEKKREKIYNQILQEAEKISIKEISEERIDEINILEATKEGMNKIIEELEEYAQICLVDAVKGLKSKSIDIVPIIKGDDTSYSVSCASIVAKVYRDKKMEEYGLVFPEYGFEKHKGYGTKAHYDAILEHGITPIHRKSFLKNLEEHRNKRKV